MKTITRKCSYCGSVEGMKRPIGNYLVELKKIRTDGETKLACQSCYLNKTLEIKKTDEKEVNMKSSLIKKLKNMFFLFTVISAFSMAELHAQGLPGPPGFPENPSEAPIDGGLGLLAAAGGAYAYNKLRNRKKEEDITDI